MPTAPTAARSAHRLLTAYVSRAETGHLDLDCIGLDRMREAGHDPADYLEPTAAASLSDLFPTDSPTRPCRICALEPVLLDLVSTAAARSRGTLFVVTALNPTSPSRSRSAPPTTDEERDRVAKLKAASAQRLVRVAAAAHLHTTQTATAPVMYGNLPLDVAETLAKRVATFTTWGTPGHVPSEEVIRTFWGLTATSRIDLQQAWLTAHDVCA